MGSPWYRAAVVLLWLGATGWLVVCKIVPSLLVGEPPSYNSMVNVSTDAPTGWWLYWNGEKIGWALTAVNRQANDTSDIHSLIHFNRIPIEQVLTAPLQALVRAQTGGLDKIEMNVENRVMLDPLNHLVDFRSVVRQRQEHPLVSIHGNVDGDRLKMDVRVGDTATWSPEVPMPDAMLSDCFSPQIVLGSSCMGQAWTVVSYSPMSLATQPIALFNNRPPMEVLYAKVEGESKMTWDHEQIPVWTLVFRSEDARGPDNDGNIRNRLWVRCDNGAVMKQEVRIGTHQLTFSGMPEKEALAIGSEHVEFAK